MQVLPQAFARVACHCALPSQCALRRWRRGVRCKAMLWLCLGFRYRRKICFLARWPVPTSIGMLRTRVEPSDRLPDCTLRPPHATRRKPHPKDPDRGCRLDIPRIAPLDTEHSMDRHRLPARRKTIASLPRPVGGGTLRRRGRLPRGCRWRRICGPDRRNRRWAGRHFPPPALASPEGHERTSRTETV